jgi:hypothetical protein
MAGACEIDGAGQMPGVPPCLRVGRALIRYPQGDSPSADEDDGEHEIQHKRKKHGFLLPRRVGLTADVTAAELGNG